MSEKDRFFNACMSLMNIDMHELVEAGIIKEGNVDNGGTSWKRFNDEPLVFLAKIDDRKRDALWNLLEARQRVKDPKAELVAALIAAKQEMWMAARHQWTMADFKNWAVIQQIDAALEKADGKPRSADAVKKAEAV